MFLKKLKPISTFLIIGLVSTTVLAHDPNFGIGPHVLFKDGLEVALEVDSAKAGSNKAQELGVQVTYGLTGDWSVGVTTPYEFKDSATATSNGLGDVALFTKYRFWRQDSLGLQESAAVFMKLITDTAQKNKSPSLNKGTTDAIVGLTYGYEARKWYRWASARYRLNGTNNELKRGDKILIDFVAGIRPEPTGYLEPDTVWLLELNGELGQKATVNGATNANTGGDEWFISPGIFWTKRNFAIKAGVQIPIASNLNGNQQKSNYRIRTTFEWHM